MMMGTLSQQLKVRMDLKPDDEFNDIDASIWLSYELDKMNLDNHLDIESALLSVEDNKIIETISSKDTKKQDLKMSVAEVQSVVEESSQDIEQEGTDINGNEESSSDKNLNQLVDNFEDLGFSDSDSDSDSDNEAADEGESSILRERGPVKKSTRHRNRTNYLQRNERYDRSQFPAGSLAFLSGATIIHSAEDPVGVNQSPILNISEILTSSNIDSINNTSPVIFEDLGASSFGSPESGYESSITGSPPQSLSLAVNNPASILDLIPETDDDDIIKLLFENTPDCALSDDDNVLRCETDDKDHQENIKKIVNFLKDTPEELSNACSNIDYVPLINNSCDKKISSGKSSPCLSRIDYKLKNNARTALRQFLPDDVFRNTEARYFRQINEDKANKREVKKIIQIVDEVDGTSENRTNLHHAVINSNLEEIYCLVEIHKKEFSDLNFWINIRDKSGKTALDYAVQKDMTLVVDYLKENTAVMNI